MEKPKSKTKHYNESSFSPSISQTPPPNTSTRITPATITPLLNTPPPNITHHSTLPTLPAPPKKLSQAVKVLSSRQAGPVSFTETTF